LIAYNVVINAISTTLKTSGPPKKEEVQEITGQVDSIKVKPIKMKYST
jgi:hypothetical protein